MAFLLWAHPSLVGLPCAALLLLAPRADGTAHARWLRPLGTALGIVSVALLVVTAGDGSGLAAVTSAYIVLVSAAFVCLVLLRPPPRDPLLRYAVRAILYGGLATAVLIQAAWGAEAWGMLAWEATRQTSIALRSVVEVAPPDIAPQAFAIYEPLVRFLSATWPGMLVLQTLAGFALAWQLCRRLAAPAPIAPLARFKDFCIGDAWVWGIVAWLIVLIVPVSGALHAAGTNVGLVAGALYLVRGAAIVATFAEAFGISTLALVIAAGAAAALALPLLFLVPGLCTLGITDTWYQYRRRLAAARAGGAGRPPESHTH
jgi:hypothetical protein